MNVPNSLRNRILAARKEIPSDFVLKKGRVVNVFSGEIKKKDVAILNGMIVGVGEKYEGRENIYLEGKWIVPGFIDAHIHIESTMLLPSQLSPALLQNGTTTIVSDPHEIANVMGLEGIRFMLDVSRDIPLDIFFMAPSCVPATHLETSGAKLIARDLALLKEEPRILGLGEMMNFPGVLTGKEDILDKIVLFRDKSLDGHCPSLGGKDLQAYLTAGIRSDHESCTMGEALEKMESGMVIMIREGSSAKNLEEILPLISKKNSRRFCFVSDDLNPEDVLERGHLNHSMKMAVSLGLDPVTAIQLATLNPSEYFQLNDRGAIAPGYIADIVVLEDLKEFKIESVFKNGKHLVNRGRVLNSTLKKEHLSHRSRKALNIALLTPDSFSISQKGQTARVIRLIQGQITTNTNYETVKSLNGNIISDVESDILKLVVVERHHGSGKIGLGLINGFGLKRGAIASSVAHDSHNVISVGVTNRDLYHAVEEVRVMGGGIAVVDGNETLGKIPLPIAGLMSTKPINDLVRELDSAKRAAKRLGCKLNDPFMSLSFLALPVIPELKLTDKGLVDVNKFEIVPLFQED